jgi:hypothetical protein
MPCHCPKPVSEAAGILTVYRQNFKGGSTILVLVVSPAEMLYTYAPRS